MPGPHKWLGGATTADGTVLLGVPSNAERIVRVDLTTGAIELTAHAPRGRFKWLRGVRARDNSVYCIPACADAVLRIAADGSVTELGRGILPVGEWKWHGGALGGDGCIYAIPANASRVLKIEPVTGTVSLIGPELQPGVHNKWYGGILAADGTIWGVPYNATSALRIDPASGEVSEVGDFGIGGWKWHGGARSGDFIIAVPSHATRVLRIDPRRRVAELIGPEFDGTYKWGGAAVDAFGIVWGIPSDAAWVLRVEPSSGAVRTLGQLSRWRNKWQGGVAAPDGNIYCVPCDAPQVLIIHPATGQLSLLGSLPLQPKKYQGGTAAPDGSIWCLPECGEQILRIDPAALHAAGGGVPARAAAVGTTSAPEAGRLKDGAEVCAAAAAEHGDYCGSEPAEALGEDGAVAGGGGSVAAAAGEGGETATQRKKRQHCQTADGRRGPATPEEGGTPPPPQHARAGRAGGVGAGIREAASSQSPTVDDTSSISRPTQRASLSCGSCSASRIGVDDAELVCDAHWEAWDLAWEAAGKLEGTRRALVTLDEALALARGDALASSVGGAAEAATGVGAPTEKGAAAGEGAPIEDGASTEQGAAGTRFSEHALGSPVGGTAGMWREGRAETVPEARDELRLAAALATGEATGGRTMAVRAISGPQLGDAAFGTSVEAVAAVALPAVISGAAAACSSEAHDKAPADGRREAVAGEGLISPLIRLSDRGDSPMRSGEADHKLQMVMLPELLDEAPPIVLCVRQVGDGYKDNTRIEPPAGFDCNINDLLKGCVLL